METRLNSNPPVFKTLSISFDLPIQHRQVVQWRGAFIEMAGWEDDLFHNHKGDEGYHRRYPLIHYRIRQNYASIVAINEGVDSLQKILSSAEWVIRWEEKPRHLQIQDLRMNEHQHRMTKRPQTYRLFKYIAFHVENYRRWLKARNYQERVTLLQEVLTGHLLGYATAMNWRLPERLEVDIQFVQMIQNVRLHNTPLLAFNLTYTCNLLLPDGIALGKGVSHGFGWQHKYKPHRQGSAFYQSAKQIKVEEMENS